MITTERVQALLQGNGIVIGSDGDKIGSVGQVFLDNASGEPEWVTVKTGLFGMSESFIPLQGATVSGDEVRVGYDKGTVKDAPRVDDSEGALSESEEATLYEYYGMSYSQTASDSGLGTGTSGDAGHVEVSGGGTYAGDADTYAGSDTGGVRDTTGTVGHDTSGPTKDDAMTRSEERLNVGTESTQSGKARLRKYVVTENVTQTVPVSHEEVRVEREPITYSNRGDALDGPAISEEEHEVTLNAERPVVDKETVPVERVRLDKETVTDNVSVDEDVRQERIEVDGDGNPKGR
ncbi:DUF2382 domain-containing protein [Cryobacterium tepidiphilum]|uniref:DUF2382 domain-containing protein n=1 Tax=Cryobacterium tepidiphilum TaxID=2486026 RepID=A0A3M8LM47_9MICO|nr:PRC and DUF2382 domain-containing protein [Cryobacterium tepidiphilum]RNE66586.1 DUF2382 domain-containing protein [Cryobacterium tepidiphilum]